MADLLRTGNVMLNMACPICNNPIFRRKSGEHFCPICNREVLIVKNDINRKSKIIEKIPVNSKAEKDKNYTYFNETLGSLKNVLLEKIEWISQQLKSETKMPLIEIYTNILSNILNILNNFPTFD